MVRFTLINHQLLLLPNQQDFIFAKTERQPGYPIVIKTAQLRMARLLALAKLNLELTPHSLRHTHTSLLAETGVALEQIMDRLDHSDDQVTKNVYLHVTKEIKKPPTSLVNS